MVVKNGCFLVPADIKDNELTAQSVSHDLWAGSVKEISNIAQDNPTFALHALRESRNRLNE